MDTDPALLEKHSLLREAVMTAQRKYHDEDNPIMSDNEYDTKVLLLKELEKSHPQLADDSPPWDVVGHTPTTTLFSKVVHGHQMLSLGNAYTVDDMATFIAAVKDFLRCHSVMVTAEEKIDGLSCSLIYNNGVLLQGSTRGDGFIGEDVTNNVRMISDIPQVLNSHHHIPIIEVRGEVYMTKADFASLNASLGETEKPYSNPRNAAAGSLRQKDKIAVRNRNLKFLAHGFIEHTPLDIETQYDAMGLLQKMGFQTTNPILCGNQIDILKAYNTILKKRDELEYDIDGVVYKVNDLLLQKRLGQTSKIPRWAIAYKFPADKVETTVESIDIQVGRTGKLTPVARLTPVLCGGVIVSNCTLHNKDEIERLNLRVGDKVVLERAGDVIPKITTNLTPDEDREPYIFPVTCPSCSAPAHPDDDGVDSRCTGSMTCDAQSVGRIIHFASREAVDIVGLGDKTVEKLWTEGYLSNPVDIYHLHKHAPMIIEREVMGELTLQNLLKAIEDRRTPDAAKVLFGLGIRNVGKGSSKRLMAQFGTLQNLRDVVLHSDTDLDAALMITGIPDIGPIILNSLQDFFREESNDEAFLDLLTQIFPPPYQTTQLGGPMSGKTIVITGTLEHLSREEAKVHAEKLGMKVGSTVSAKTDYILAGAKAGAKLKKALSFGTTQLTEAEFIKLGE